MKRILFLLILAAAVLAFDPRPVFCVYCAGGTPCASDADCSLGCRCQAPPYMQGVCISGTNP